MVDIDVDNHAVIIQFCIDNDIGFVVIGPEGPLVAGLADDLAAAKIKVFGPSKAAARLEGSKGFTKDFCAEFGIPTAAYKRCTDATTALAYLAEQPLPIVVKADGLAAGKGVVIAETREQAAAAVEACFSGAFGAAGAEVVIEECLVGEEASFFALIDGTHALRARRGAGPQARLRRRAGPQHRRHGRLFAGPCHDGRDRPGAPWTRSSGRPCKAWRRAARRSRACCSRA